MCVPKFRVEIPGSDWTVVVTSDASHFYHNKTTRQSTWRADDEQLRQAITRLDRRLLLLLTAKARGLPLDEKANQILLVSLHAEPAEDRQVGDGEEADKNQEPVQSTSVRRVDVSVKSTGLLGDYSSSEDEFDDAEDETDANEASPSMDDQAQEREEDGEHDTTDDDCGANTHEEAGTSSGEENGFDLADLDEISSDEGDSEPVSRQQAETEFFQLLQDSSLDPYSPWETESLKIIDDPRFLQVDNNKDRKALFDNWCTIAISTENYSKVSTRSTRKKLPPFVEFMSFLESRDCDRFYKDFKGKWRDDLDRIQLGEREKEKKYKEYVILTNKSQSDKEIIFKKLLTDSKVFRRNLLESGTAKDVLCRVKLDGLEAMTTHDSYDLLFLLEEAFGISNTLKNTTKYFLVDVKERVRILVELAKLMLLDS